MEDVEMGGYDTAAPTSTTTTTIDSSLLWPKMTPRAQPPPPSSTSSLTSFPSFSSSSSVPEPQQKDDYHHHKENSHKEHDNDDDDDETFDPTILETLKDELFAHEMDEIMKELISGNQAKAENKKHKDKKAQQAARLKLLPEQKDLLPHKLPECFEGQEPNILQAKDVGDTSRCLFLGGSNCGKSTAMLQLLSQKKFPRNIAFCFSPSRYDGGFGQRYERSMIWHYWDPFAIQKIELQQTAFRKMLEQTENSIRRKISTAADVMEEAKARLIQEEALKLKQLHQWSEEKYAKELKKLKEKDMPEKIKRKKKVAKCQEALIALWRKQYALSMAWDDIATNEVACKSKLFENLLSAGRHKLFFQCVAIQNPKNMGPRLRSNFDHLFLFKPDQIGKILDDFALNGLFPQKKGPAVMRDIFNYVGELNKRLVYGQYRLSFRLGGSNLQDSFSLYYVSEKIPENVPSKLGDPIFQWLARITLDPKRAKKDDEEGETIMQALVQEHAKKQKRLGRDKKPTTKKESTKKKQRSSTPSKKPKKKK
jgi:hypothetical protein